MSTFEPIEFEHQVGQALIAGYPTRVDEACRDILAAEADGRRLMKLTLTNGRCR